MSEKGISIDAFLDRWAYICLLVFLASLVFSTALMEITSVAAFIGWAILRVRRRNFASFERKTFLALVGFVFLSVISFSWSEFPKQSFRGIFKVLQQFMLFWVVAETLATRERQVTAFTVLTFVFIALGLDGIWQYVFGADLIRRIAFEPASAGPRISASFHNYGLLASFVVSFVPLLFARLEKRRGARHLFSLCLGIALGLLLLFWTRLRGAWIALLGGVLFFLWLDRKKVYVGLVMLAVAVGFLLLPKSMIIHLDAEGKEQSLVERFYLWDRAIQVIEARPWTGTGINTYAVAHQQYDRRHNWRVRNYYSHNGYLQIAAETGLPSLACFLAFLLFYFRGALGLLGRLPDGVEKRSLIGILSGMLNFLILGLIDTIFHNPQAIMGFWFLAGWGIAYQNVVAESRGVSFPKG